MQHFVIWRIGSALTRHFNNGLGLGLVAKDLSKTIYSIHLARNGTLGNQIIIILYLP